MTRTAEASTPAVVWLGDDPRNPDRLLCRVRVPGADCIGHGATLTLERVVHVKDSRPVHHRKELWRTTFDVRSLEHELSVPRSALGRGYAYAGHQIEVRLESRVVIDDGLLVDTKVEGVHRIDGLDRPRISGDARELAEPDDAFDFLANLGAIPPGARARTIALAVVGAVLIVVNALIGFHDQMLPDPQTWLYDHVDSDGDGQSPLVTALMGCGALGSVVWLLMRKQLRRYMTFRLRRRPAPTRAARVAASDLVAGRSRVALEGATVRVVAYNVECGQYVRGSGSSRRTVSFSTPARAVTLFEQVLPHVPAGAALGARLRGDVAFGPMFAALYPPSMVGPEHGIGLRWEVQLLHPDFVDQEIVCDGAGLPYEEFLYG